MSLPIIKTELDLDVYDYNLSQSLVKTIALDSGSRMINARILSKGKIYDVGSDANVVLTILLPNGTGVQVAGDTYGYTDIEMSGEDRIVTVYGVTVTLPQLALAIKGRLMAQFKITSDSRVVRTEIFIIENGQALDEDITDWVEYQGHNLDEMAQSIEDLSSDVTEIQTDVSELKSGFSDVDIALHKVPSMTNGSGDADLYISDDAGNALAKFQDGGFQVKKFKGFDFETYRSDTKVYTGSQLTFTIGRHFDKGDRIVLHMERGEMPWAYGAYVTYKVGQTIIKDNWRGDCAWFVHTLAEDTDEISAIYPANSAFVPRSTNITFEVSLLGDVPVKPTVVTIKQDGTGDFTTLRGALDSIGTKANDVLNPYRIEIYKGTYDVLADYTDAEIRAAAYTQTDFVGPKLLNGMYLVGMGLPEEVVLTASLDPETYDNNIRGAISTLNCQGTCGMENLTVEAHNIRYCVHDDYHTQLQNKPKRTVKNCVFRGYGVSYTPGTTYGAGTSPTGCDYEFINCDFGENAGVHTMPTTQFRSLIHLINCTGGGFRIGDNATTDVTVTGYDVFRFDGCGFPWIRNNVDGSVPHAIVKGSGNRPPMYQLTVNTLYETDDVTVVPNVNLAFTGGVGTVVEWFSDSAHGPRFRIATSAKTAVGVVVYQDSDNTYIQTRGYVCTDRANVTAFALGDYVGVSNGQAVIVTDDGDAFGKIKFVDASGFGYIALKGA